MLIDSIFSSVRNWIANDCGVKALLLLHVWDFHSPVSNSIDSMTCFCIGFIAILNEKLKNLLHG